MNQNILSVDHIHSHFLGPGEYEPNIFQPTGPLHYIIDSVFVLDRGALDLTIGIPDGVNVGDIKKLNLTVVSILLFITLPCEHVP
jgi:hypothetical protein